MRTDNRVLYFSLNPKSVLSFYDCLDQSSLDCQCFFRAIEREQLFDKENGNALKFRHASDLLFFLDTYSKESDLGCLYVIIDYPSFFNAKKHCSFFDLDKTNELESFSVKDAAKTIRRAILQYPEVFFLFDESWNTKNDFQGFPSFLFYFNSGKYLDSVYVPYHQYAIQAGDPPFDAILRGRSNLFDGSHLRGAVKQYEYDELSVERYNFSLVQNSRKENLAICVEEERAQNRFNSYVLYANGFRVMPVSTSRELKDINDHAAKLNPKLIVRDYDLQFPDVDDKAIQVSIQDKESYLIHTIDYIRGAKFLRKEDNIWNQEHNKKEWLEDDAIKYLDKWYVPPFNSDHSYWDKLLKVQDILALFVSKGAGDRIRFLPSSIDFKKSLNRELKKSSKTANDALGLFVDGIPHQIMRGTTKPVSGIYTVFRQFNRIKTQYDSFQILKDNQKKDKGVEDKSQEWYLDTNRANHEHGVPLDIYDTVKEMIARAKKYYSLGKYIRSAIIASEAIEVLNGFHEALVLQAYHILAISENALAMSIVGGNEEDLNLDTSFRISKIVADVNRLTDREDSDRRRIKYNLLIQIFSECRAFCREKQHFASENLFISALAHVNEGYKYKDIWLAIKELYHKSITTIRQFFHILGHAETTD